MKIPNDIDGRGHSLYRPLLEKEMVLTQDLQRVINRQQTELVVARILLELWLECNSEDKQLQDQTRAFLGADDVDT